MTESETGQEWSSLGGERKAEARRFFAVVMSRIWQMIMSRGLGAGLDALANTIFTTLVKSNAFRKAVSETEKAALKAIRYAGNPEKETQAFHKSEADTIDYLAEKARQAASAPPPGAKPQASSSNSDFVPPNMTSAGYQPESDYLRWLKTKRYEFGVWKQKWFG